VEVTELEIKCHAVEEVSSKLGSGTILLGRGPTEHEELGTEELELERLELVEVGADELVLEILKLVELVVTTLELVEGALELLVEDGVLDDDEGKLELVDGAEEDVDRLDDDVDEVEISDELDGELENVDMTLQVVLVVTAGEQYSAET
jgi:hypothetical protein